MIELGVNIDHVATLRQARSTRYPSPLQAALIAETAGADAITLHLREDRRHIQDADVERLAAGVRTVLNLELATSPDILALACRLRPYQATLVPERREEITTEGGLEVGRDDPRLRDAIARLTGAGIRVSLFIDPTRPAIERSRALGVPAVELHTGRYAHAAPGDDAALDQLKDAARHARTLGLAVHAGHGLTYRNVARVAAIAELEELNIGHSIVSRAVMTGMEEATAEMLRLVREARVD
jgi:pyridoxine 5-phosphate synthase